jgi:hypothetical protein
VSQHFELPWLIAEADSKEACLNFSANYSKISDPQNRKHAVVAQKQG